MSNELQILTVTAASIGLFHTLLGPDHYIPFIAMAKARQWSLAKTAIITLLCGLAHVGSSIVLGLIGIAVGIAVWKLEAVESSRGDIAAWLLTAFGLVYMVYGIRRAIRNRPHTHSHLHAGYAHAHDHRHQGEHAHPHEQPDKMNITPWVLFTVFVFGPCEPLIPILMYPAAARSVWGMALVATVFGVVTIGTMMVVVLVSAFGLQMLPLKRLERYSHALGGAAITICGVAIHLGL